MSKMNNDGKFAKGRYTTIPETKNIKLPIGGRIRLGIRVKNEQGIEYPKETNYFVCPKVVRDVYGDEPTELTVFFPNADREKVFPQNYEKYGSNEALLCWGDGEASGQRLNLENGRWEDIKCPCEHYNKKYDKTTKIGGCGKAGYLRFMIPSVSIGTFYQCRVGGTVSIEECNSAFYLAEKTTGGCWAMIPFRMRRVLKKLKIPGTAKMKDHWVVTLEVAASVEEIRRVSAGEILYLGQQKNGHYELEAIEPAKAKEDEVVIEPDTEEETKERETEETEREEALKKDYEESKAREVQLKKDQEEGKGKLKSYKESKTIYKKKQEEKGLEKQKDADNIPLNEWPDAEEKGKKVHIEISSLSEEQNILDLINSRAKDVGINSFGKLIDFAVEKGIFQTPLAEKLALKVLATNKEVINRLFKAFEEIPETKKREEGTEVERLLANLFNKAKDAGKGSWKAIIYEGCKYRMPDRRYIFEIGTTEEEAKKILIEDPEKYKNLEEAFIAIAKSEGK